MRLLCITQGIGDLEAVYPKTWRKFLGNADAVYWLGMGANDTQSPGELAKILGTATRKERVGGSIAMIRRGRPQKLERPLVYPEQLPRLLRGNNIIVTRYDQRHLRLKGVPYYLELPVTHYTPDPEHRERPARAATRRVVKRLQRERVDLATAMQMFGLPYGYSRDDVESHYELLSPSRQRNTEFAALARRARILLLRKAAP